MNTVVVVALVLWMLPIVGVAVAYVVLSRRITRELKGLTRNLSVSDKAVARRYVSDVKSVRVLSSADERNEIESDHPMVHRRSSRVDVTALQKERLFTVSNN